MAVAKDSGLWKISAWAVLLLLLELLASGCAGRQDILLCDGWKFTKADGVFSEVALDVSSWESVTIPHDWAIYGPFDADNDAQTVAISQNLETVASLKTGRTGSLPHVGTGWYRTVFDVPGYSDGKSVELVFDGAMSHAQVYVNGRKAGEWPYGYNSFHFDVSDLINGDGKGNVLAVRLENLPESARWYPGAGLYRNVHLVVTDRIHVPVWGTHVVCPRVCADEATVEIEVKVDGTPDRVKTVILGPDGKRVASCKAGHEGSIRHVFRINAPQLWSPESPSLYSAVTSVYSGARKVDEYRTVFGIREIELVPGEGFLLNGTKRKIKGVCNHHDLGPLGAAVNEAALRHQLTLLKDMGCDAIRTAHNMPAPELVRLCDEMGFMMMVESFDEWDISKCANGYSRIFDEWAEKDLVNMLHQYRNSPSVVFWSIGNEVPSQNDSTGCKTAAFLYDICHREDPARFVTCGMDQVLPVLESGFAEQLDIPGFNYRVNYYGLAHQQLPGKLILGSETASTLSTRGIYKFPAERKMMAMYPDRYCSSYDLECCSWSNLPEDDFAMAEDNDWDIGQFVWTGFDYLGEPTPYESMPNHSSNFGIIDLASIPKDRYYLYRSVWKPEDETLHIVPHWTWPSREGETTPVFVYTNHPSAELFVNGISQGIRTKDMNGDLERYRLIWEDVTYEPGELKVVAYDETGKAVSEKCVRTAGQPHHLVLTSDRTRLHADGKDLAYIEVTAVDADGNVCPLENSSVSFSTEGDSGFFRASANGDPTSLELFHIPEMHLFNGKLTAIVQTTDRKGRLVFRAHSEKMIDGELAIQVR
ncbi:MAG: DUF4982 domain-containing protein [Bacteroidales bacterium]|nr:DUF4982 domain-containing protein [Candidatus Cryptobacteroides caccocaballi]